MAIDRTDFSNIKSETLLNEYMAAHAIISSDDWGERYRKASSELPFIREEILKRMDRE